MTCVHCGRRGAYRERRPKKSIEQTVCPHCGRVDVINIPAEQTKLPIEIDNYGENCSS